MLFRSVGARYQEIETKSYDYNSGAFLSGYEGDEITPALGLVYKPTEQVSLYANYAEALLPGATAPAVSGGQPVLNAGEVLAPFRAEQIEAGVKYDAGDFGGTLSVFRTTQPSAFVENQIFADNGEQRNQGVELGVYGQPLEGVRLLGGVTWLDAELTRTAGGAFDGQTPIGVAEIQANVNVEWDVPAVTGLTVEGRVVYTGEQQVNLANTIELDAWTRVDLGARYTLDVSAKPVVLRARVENVADDNYWASTGGYPNANYLVLGSPRTFVLSASVDF